MHTPTTPTTTMTTTLHATSSRRNAMPITPTVPTTTRNATDTEKTAMPTAHPLTTTLFTTLLTTPHRRTAMPLTTAVPTTPLIANDTEKPMTDTRLISTIDSPANDVTPHRAAHHGGARSPAMPTAITVQTRTDRHSRTAPTHTTTPEIHMPPTSIPSSYVPSLTLVHSAPDARKTETSPVPAQSRPSLRASQVHPVAEEELAFFFSIDPDNDTSAPARRVIARWIATLPERDQDALSLYFDREPWPASIRKHGIDHQRGYALVLAHASAYERWPNVPQRWAHLRHASLQLEAAVDRHGPRVLRYLTRRSEWTFAAALRAYVMARGRAPSVLGAKRPGRKEAP
jgi:hypothetical protein